MRPAAKNASARPKRAGALRVGEQQVVTDDVARLDAGLAKRDGEHVGVCIEVDRRTPDRLGMPLLVEGEPLAVHLAVEVDRELRDAQHRTGANEVRRAVDRDHAAGELEFAIEPRVQQRTAVHLDSGLQQPLGVRRGIGLQLERRRIGVRAENAKGRRDVGIGRLHPRDDGAVAHDDAAPGGRRPLVCLVEQLESGIPEAPGDLCGRVVRRRGGLDERGEVGDVRIGVEGRHASIQHRSRPSRETAALRRTARPPEVASEPP